jgi:hypothetical protein
LNKSQHFPTFHVVRVALGVRYNRVEVNRRASRNGRVSDLPPEIATVSDAHLFHRVYGQVGTPVPSNQPPRRNNGGAITVLLDTRAASECVGVGWVCGWRSRIRT